MLIVGLLAATAGQATTYTVTSAADLGPNSLRQALLFANADPATPHVIEFNIAGCPCTITLGFALPPVQRQTDINGYTQSGSAVNTLPTATNANLQVVIDAGGQNNALVVTGANSRVRGLVFQNYAQVGVLVNTGGNNTSIDGNFFGTNRTGTAASGAANVQRVGVRVNAGVSGVQIGGTAAGARNLISNQGFAAIALFGSSASVAGNLIGTDGAGTGSIPNGLENPPNRGAIRVDNSSGNTIGGPTAAHRNVISGNAGDAIHIFQGAGGNLVQNNYIGLDHTGAAALPNTRHGVVFFAVGGATASGNTIDSNVIANQPRKGITVDGPVFTGVTITNNLIGTAADGVTPMGNGFGMAPAGFGPDPAIDVLNGADAQVANNRILHNNIGILVREFEGPAATGFGNGSLNAGSTGNCVVFNGTGVDNTTGVLNTFENNWWGSSDGPSGAGSGSGDSVSADIDYDPFLVAAPGGCPSYPEASGRKLQDVTGDGPSGDDVALSGVSIDLWRDGGNGTFDAGPDDTLVATQVTDGSGAYAFLGLTPGERYFVAEDQASLPANYVQTYGGDDFAGGTSYYTIDAAIDQVSGNLDFGNALAADLSITKSAAPSSVGVGNNVVFTITVMNAGPGDAANVVVTDVLPAELTLAATSGCLEDPVGIPTCTLGTITSGNSAQYTVTTVATAEGVVLNQATVTATTPEVGGGNETAVATVTIGPGGVQDVPTLGTLGFVLFGLLLALGGAAFLWRS